MFFVPTHLAINNQGENYAVCADGKPLFSWGACHSEKERFQTEYLLRVFDDFCMYWDSGWINSGENIAEYKGLPLPSGRKITWELTLKDNDGKVSKTAKNTFVTAFLKSWLAPSITSKLCDKKSSVVCYIKTINVKKPVKSAALFCCGLGYHSVSINGKGINENYLEPAWTNYKKIRYYTTNVVTDFVKNGENRLEITVADGWRRNFGGYLDNEDNPDTFVEFFGRPQLSAILYIEYSDGTSDEIFTDESWQCSLCPTVKSHLFDGELYDERLEDHEFELENAILCNDKIGQIYPQTIPPVIVKRRIKPKRVRVYSDRVLYDFSENIAGFIRLKINNSVQNGTEITIKYGEMLDENGNLFTKPLRSAKSTDVFIATKKQSERFWSPKFTYHGFRYVEISGMESLDDIEAEACVIYTDVDKNHFFKCGNAVINEIHDCIMRTERSNIHGLATDCPQRDERQGWLNDATVRFEKMPYEFETGALYEKILADINAEQLPDGSIGCTAPFIYGQKPADPVCSSYLLLAYESYLFNGNCRIISDNYKRFKAWNEKLKECSTDGIVNYSLYGDWAAPVKYCAAPENPRSIATPGELMSTGYHYFNYILLAKFAEILGNDYERKLNIAQAQRVKEAFCAKWVNDNGIVANGSQGSQAFALWLGILPEDLRVKAAQHMAFAVETADYALTTGNLTTRYLFDMLTEYGYVNYAMKIIERTEYPSIGYMLNHRATTIWERFELKKTDNMNSHNHPMYGACGLWFYKYLCGIYPLSSGFKKFTFKPYFPDKLHYAEFSFDTSAGNIYACWEKRGGGLYAQLNVPFGCNAEVVLPGINRHVSSGFYEFEIPEGKLK